MLFRSLRFGNNGPLLPEATAGRLFDSMISVRKEASGNNPHLGLGLYIVRLIAEFHGGNASARNREDRSGVVIEIRLPAAGWTTAEFT